jgi:hypothetical protein
MRQESRSPMDKQVHSIASDFLRNYMIQNAMCKAAALARDNFYYALGITDIGDEDLDFFAEDAWRIYTSTIHFDYPSYAHTLFLQAYRMAYHVYELELPNGHHPSLPILAAELEVELGLASNP